MDKIFALHSKRICLSSRLFSLVLQGGQENIQTNFLLFGCDLDAV